MFVSRYDASEDVGSPCSHGEVKIERTDGSCCRQKEHNFSVFVHGSAWPGSGRRAFHHGHSVLDRRSLDWKMAARTKEAWMWLVHEVQMWRQVRGPAGAVMCETRDLGIKWPRWHALVFSSEITIDMRHVCPKDVKKMLVQRAQEGKRGLDRKASSCGQNDLAGR